MGKIIAISNQKGGVGKSTTVVNLAAALGGKGKKVLVIDSDIQGNTTTSFGIRKKNIKNTTYEMLIGEARIADCIIKTAFKNVSIVPSAQKLAGAEIELNTLDNKLLRMKMQLLTVKQQFDFILIDTPPSLGLLTLNALATCDSVIIPTQCEFLSLEGLVQISETIKRVRQSYNPTIEIEGIVFTMYVGRYNVTGQVAAEIEKYFPDKAFSTVIPRNITLSEAPSHGKPVMYYDVRSKGSESYLALCNELLSRQKKNKKAMIGGLV